MHQGVKPNVIRLMMLSNKSMTSLKNLRHSARRPEATELAGGLTSLALCTNKCLTRHLIVLRPNPPHILVPDGGEVDYLRGKGLCPCLCLCPPTGRQLPRARMHPPQMSIEARPKILNTGIRAVASNGKLLRNIHLLPRRSVAHACRNSVT